MTQPDASLSVTFIEMVREAAKRGKRIDKYCPHCDKKNMHIIRSDGREQIYICCVCHIGTRYAVK